MENVSAEKIATIIRNKTHAYTEEMISKDAVEKLSLFLSQGQIDMDKYIDGKTKKARGDTTRDARFYMTLCAVCHGTDGRAANFGSDEEPEYVGTLANKNPWETLHKIRFGQPNKKMTGLNSLDIQDQIDILSYT